MDLLNLIKDKNSLSQKIKDRAKELGFRSCGISKAGFLEEEASHLEQYLKEGRNGKMKYMENHFDMRLDPRLLVDGAKSVISLTFNYYPEIKQREDSYHIAKFAYGEDYHFVIRDKLREILAFIMEEAGTEVNGRVFTDSAPILEDAWARRSGLGWIGKHTLLLTKQVGSFFLLSEIIIDLELDYDEVTVSDHCGTCARCIDACPTDAIMPDRRLNASQCISYFTIELKDELIPKEVKGKFNDWVFGCDICQDVCPWNRFSTPHNEPRFMPKKELLDYSKKDWEDITEEIYREIFRRSSVKRAKFSGFKRNIEFVSNPSDKKPESGNSERK